MRDELIMERYTIKICNKGISLTNPKQYGKHASNGNYYKIYVIKDENNILYIGMTKQNIRARFSGSFRAYIKKKENGISAYNGYAGYKWIDDFQKSKKELDLFVFPFENKSTNDDKFFIEAVEAEIAFLIRSEAGKWPLYQHEIHFHNIEEAITLAEKIYNQTIN